MIEHNKGYAGTIKENLERFRSKYNQKLDQRIFNNISRRNL